jgi:hypothetical protein
MAEYVKIPVGTRYLVIGEGNEWKVMEQFGSYRMLKKTFKTQAAAVRRAEAMLIDDWARGAR